MQRRCSLCSHAKRRDLDAELARGEPFRSIAKRYGTAASTVLRHKAHVAEALAEVCAQRERDTFDLYAEIVGAVARAKGYERLATTGPAKRRDLSAAIRANLAVTQALALVVKGYERIMPKAGTDVVRPLGELVEEAERVGAEVIDLTKRLRQRER